MHRAESRQALLQRFAARGFELAHVGVRVAVAGAHFGSVAALTHAFREPLPRRVFALQPVAAGQVVRAAARFTLGARAHQTTAAAVRHVPARAARARARAHITAGRAGFGLGFGAGRGPDAQQHNRR